MLIDILIIGPMIIFTLLGLRDGIVRKLVAIVVFIAGLILGQIYMRDVGNFLAGNGWVEPLHAPAYGFLLIFLGLAVLQGVLYRVLTGGYKIKGISDRIGGTVLGFIEGLIFLSALLYILAFSGFPSRDTARDSRLYKSTVNIAPQILDMTSALSSDTFQRIKDFTSPNTPSDSTAVLETKKQNDLMNSARKSGRN